MKVHSVLSIVHVFHSMFAVADYTVNVDRSNVLTPVWDGWGTSLAWWANVYGDRTDMADMFYTNASSVSLTGGPQNLPGLNFNIARYNIGGSSSNTIDGQYKLQESDRMPPFKAIESYWLDWFDTNPDSSSWNWNADAKQRAMLIAISKRGANIFEAFSNSPPWWMNNNHAVAGSFPPKKLNWFLGLAAKRDDSRNNLQQWNHDKFAIYLATVVEQAHTKWGIDFKYVEPFNEPSAEWWTFPGGQEGCPFNVEAQNDVLKMLRQQLDQRSLSNVLISASDENTVDVSLKTLQSIQKDSNALQAIGKVNTHGYEGLAPYRGGNRGNLKSLVRKLNKGIWDSELADQDDTGLTLAESIALDINEMGVSGIVYWQVLDSGGWGLIQSNPGVKWMGSVNPKYFVMAQYSRHILPGSQILASSDPRTVVAYDPVRRVLVLVTVNMENSAQSITYDVSVCGAISSDIKSWLTVTPQDGLKYAVTSDVVVRASSLIAPFPAHSVRTIEIPCDFRG